MAGERNDQVAEAAHSRIWTVPNLISVARLVAIPVIVWLLLGPEWDALAVGLLLVAGASDGVDGWLARHLDQRTRLGELLDPIADRLYILAIAVSLALRDIIPWWLAVLLPLRDVLMWLLVPLLRSRGLNALPVHFLGKAATFCLLCGFPLLFLGDDTTGAGVLAAVFGWAFAVWGLTLYWWTGIVYAVQVRRLLVSTEPVSRR
ncbi:CDP-alcohol phosphatidyltransferase family protein [soil metagenome]